MTTRDELNARLFVAKQQLRLLEETSADAKKAASETSTEFAPESYLSIAADLDRQAATIREEIEEFEKICAQLA